MNREVERTELLCSVCGRETIQDITYAGRLMTHARCSYCGTVVHFGRPSLHDDYLQDLRQRLQSKPRRLLHRATKHPLRFLRSLPAAIVRQPAKLFGEFRTVHDEAQEASRQSRYSDKKRPL